MIRNEATSQHCEVDGFLTEFGFIKNCKFQFDFKFTIFNSSSPIISYLEHCISNNFSLVCNCLMTSLPKICTCFRGIVPSGDFFLSPLYFNAVKLCSSFFPVRNFLVIEFKFEFEDLQQTSMF